MPYYPVKIFSRWLKGYKKTRHVIYAMAFQSEYDAESQRVRIHTMGSIYGPSIEDYDVVMAAAIDKLLEIRRLVRIVFSDRREHECDFPDVKMLLEIANAMERIVRERVITLKNIVRPDCERESQERYAFLNRFFSQLKYDPIEAYKQLLREIRHAEITVERGNEPCTVHYLANALVPLKNIMESCRMIQYAKERLPEHRNRSLYRQLFHPSIRPNFMYTRYVAAPPATAELVERYAVGDTDIEIYALPSAVRKLYHFVPPEFKLREEED